MSRGFQFKQFSIEHASCGMKVGTDSIMLGSWINVGSAKHILDIGTGSGLLAIMLAQKASEHCQIVGIDIDEQAIEQARENGLQSPWQQKLSFKQISLQQYNNYAVYDLIVCNPPYFVINQAANLQNDQEQRVTARQTIDLSHEDLLAYSAKKLSKNGRFCCVLPAEVENKFVALAEQFGLYCCKQMAIKSKPDGKVIRHLYQFSKKQKELSYNNICIHNVNGGYSVDYRTLCKQYYLNF